MADRRTEVVKVTSPWGNTSYDAYADGERVGNYRLKADATRAANERRCSSRARDAQLDEDLTIEF